MLRLSIQLILLACSLLFWVEPLTAQRINVREERIKAACIYHITQFVTWPKKAEKSKHFTVCSSESERTITYLEDTLKNKVKGSKPYKIRSVAKDMSKNNVLKCDLLFLEQVSDAEKKSIAKSIKLNRTLVVSGGKHSLTEYIPIAIYKTDNKVAINIKLEALKKKGFQVSAELLQIAEIE